MKKLRIGFVGCGGIANQKHFPALSKLSDKVEMVAFCDIVVERARNAAEKYGSADAKYYEDYKQLLLDESIDVVHVLTPNISHSEITVASLESGKHVMCEKPMAINSAEAKKMIDARDRTGKILSIGYQNRFRHDSLVLKNACEEEELGEIYFAKAHAVRRKGVPTWGVFPDKAKQGGGPLIDIGTHALDLTLWMMDNYKPKYVVGSTYQKLKDNPMGNMFGPWDPKTYEVEDSAFGFIKMENGATIYLEAAWALNILNAKEAQVTLCGTEKGAEMNGKAFADEGFVIFNGAEHGELVQTMPSKAGGVAYFSGESNKANDVEARAWIDALLNNKEPVVTAEQAYVVTQILEAIYRSAETGEPVFLD
ncbi:Gfo/Idh/MocA family oxidoreductase [Klebsiella pneumoniae]|nr:Gfo/Idh/MocA family oxidoreductase [Klebsiella pneumoniae]